MRAVNLVLLSCLGLLIVLSSFGCTGKPAPGEAAYERRGDEIMVAGQLFHTGAPVVLWTDPGGFDAYRTERRFAPYDEAAWEQSKDKLDTPNRYGQRHRGDWPEPILEQIRGGGWTLPLLQETVDQFVIHYDVCGTSRRCFEVLHDHRGLSAHFLLDLDGTIYQTLDLKERAWHASKANDRSIGVEIANIGARSPESAAALEKWYGRDEDGRTIVTLPEKLAGDVRTAGFVARPAQPEPVAGRINGRDLVQYDLTPQQYDSLIKLTAALCEIFPKLRCDAPRDADGRVRTDRPLTDEEFAAFQGVLGHHHVVPEKVDPGPAFQWERVLGEARRR